MHKSDRLSAFTLHFPSRFEYKKEMEYCERKKINWEGIQIIGLEPLPPIFTILPGLVSFEKGRILNRGGLW